MRITQLSIENYKSLRNITISPTQLNVIVGANAAGKSNFADCLDFISDVYRHGLEMAVSRKGGYENIAFRKTRRSRKPIKIGLSVEFFSINLSPLDREDRKTLTDVKVEHSFAFVTRGFSIRTAFEVIQENLVISRRTSDEWEIIANLKRTIEDYSLDVKNENERPDFHSGNLRFEDGLTLFRFFVGRDNLLPTELLISSVGGFVPLISMFQRVMGSIRVFQISPAQSRVFGIPTPTAELERQGKNLPAVIDLLQKQHPEAWQLVMQAMRAILPDLKSINVDYTPTKTLGLFFDEEGFGRPWGVDEVSDGTLQTLAILVAIFNPSSSVLVIEEPENSVHPWILRHILDACREASKNKQIILTTHSPIIMNAVNPEEVWVIWRSKGESQLAPLTEIDPEFLAMWQHGDVSTFDYIDSGALPHAIPPEPSLVLDQEEE
ncbi:MAG TPA: AAA family ATPase [Herpetosiphonaceae bacterium]